MGNPPGRGDFLSINVWMHVSMFVCAWVCVKICLYHSMCVYVCLHVYMYVYTYVMPDTGKSFSPPKIFKAHSMDCACCSLKAQGKVVATSRMVSLMPLCSIVCSFPVGCRKVRGGKSVSASPGKTDSHVNSAPLCMLLDVFSFINRDPFVMPLRTAYPTATSGSVVVDMGANSEPPLALNPCETCMSVNPRHRLISVVAELPLASSPCNCLIPS
mmetsp:Transcript_33480/g.48970  ORF Transcript_33480/g.48970 Transcript_33480/m.48970 type:complete len:214 (+) Transcript_33480:525-1166(+)